MGEITITRRDADKKWNRPTDQQHRFVLRNFRGYILEVEDVHFHHDSAVLLPDFGPGELSADTPEPDRITGLAILAACYRHANQHASQKILIVGHTDTTGAADYNLTLSQMRADNILYALLGNREQWVNIVQQKHKVEDYQQILTWITYVWGWRCHPGPKDNQLGSRTRAGIEAFQHTYNQEFRASIATDGIVGPQTWGAFFDVYMAVLMDMLETDEAGLASLRQGLRFLSDERQRVGCGENFPIEAPRRDNYRSRINRRVEILFFDPGEEPQMKCHPGPDTCLPGKCEIYNPKMYQFRHIPVSPIAVGGGTFILELFDDVKILEDSVLVIEGLKRPLRLPVRDHFDANLGSYSFWLRPTVPGSLCTARLETPEGDHVLFEQVDLHAFVQSAVQSETEPPIAVYLSEELVDHLQEVEEETIDAPVPEGEDGDWEFADTQAETESVVTDEPGLQLEFDHEFDSKGDN
jgi:hypothetical protein